MRRAPSAFVHHFCGSSRRAAPRSASLEDPCPTRTTAPDHGPTHPAAAPHLAPAARAGPDGRLVPRVTALERRGWTVRMVRAPIGHPSRDPDVLGRRAARAGRRTARAVTGRRWPVGAARTPGGPAVRVRVVPPLRLVAPGTGRLGDRAPATTPVAVPARGPRRRGARVRRAAARTGAGARPATGAAQGAVVRRAAAPVVPARVTAAPVVLIGRPARAVLLPRPAGLTGRRGRIVARAPAVQRVGGAPSAPRPRTAGRAVAVLRVGPAVTGRRSRTAARTAAVRTVPRVVVPTGRHGRTGRSAGPAAVDRTGLRPRDAPTDRRRRSVRAVADPSVPSVAVARTGAPPPVRSDPPAVGARTGRHGRSAPIAVRATVSPARVVPVDPTVAAQGLTTDVRAVLRRGPVRGVRRRTVAAVQVVRRAATAAGSATDGAPRSRRGRTTRGARSGASSRGSPSPRTSTRA